MTGKSSRYGCGDTVRNAGITVLITKKEGTADKHTYLICHHCCGDVVTMTHQQVVTRARKHTRFCKPCGGKAGAITKEIQAQSRGERSTTEVPKKPALVGINAHGRYKELDSVIPPMWPVPGRVE